MIPSLLFQTTLQTTKPNIIVIMADDLGYGDLSHTGSLQIPTPNIDRIAKEGITYTQAYSSAPVCAPSRTGFLTGQYQNRYGCEYNMGGDGEPGYDPEQQGLPPEAITFPERLQKAGYTTGLVGKWHQGLKPQFHPTRHGFTEFYGFLQGNHDYFKDQNRLESNVETPKPITYLTDDLGEAALRFIDRQKSNPYFLFLSFNAPHTPMQALNSDLKLFSKIKTARRQTYAAMVHRLDQNVGKLFAHLESKSQLDNTMIVFLSDNGGPEGNSSINAPYRGQKGITLEGGIHIPLFIRYPKAFAAGSTSASPTINLDLAPTFLELANSPIPAKETDGHSLLQPPIQRSIFWKFGPTSAFRAGPLKLFVAEDRFPQLYDLPNDPSELINLADKDRSTAESMLQQLSDWRSTLAQPRYIESLYWRNNQLSLINKNYQLKQPR